MEGNSGVNRAGAGDLIPGEESRVQEMIDKQDHDDQHQGDVESDDVLFRGWSKTGKRKENCTRARENITVFSRHGKEKLKKRKASESPRASNAGDHERSPSSGSRIMEPGEQGNDGVADPGAESRDDQEHVCNICNRSFKSYQALGGHKAHHNTDDKGEDVSFTEEKRGSASRRPRKTNQVHQCTVCDRIFSQGQALGGHKRHCKGPAPPTCGGEVGTGNRPRVPDFDLNELPPEWNPDE